MWTAVAYSQEPPPSWWTLLQALNYVASDVLYHVQVPCWRHLCQMGRAQLYSPSAKVHHWSLSWGSLAHTSDLDGVLSRNPRTHQPAEVDFWKLVLEEMKETDYQHLMDGFRGMEGSVMVQLHFVAASQMAIVADQWES
jgi:hypothetical protein